VLPGGDQPGQLPLTDLRIFADVFNQIRTSYVEEVDDRTLLENAIKGMLSGLDPHSAYPTRIPSRTCASTPPAKFGGVGLEVGVDSNGFCA